MRSRSSLEFAADRRIEVSCHRGRYRQMRLRTHTARVALFFDVGIGRSINLRDSVTHGRLRPIDEHQGKVTERNHEREASDRNGRQASLEM